MDAESDDTPRLAPQRVILWQNGNVMVFDAHGEQVAKYQGSIHCKEDTKRLDALRAIIPESQWERRVWG